MNMHIDKESWSHHRLSSDTAPSKVKISAVSGSKISAPTDVKPSAATDSKRSRQQ